jgi:hypothetical protein
VDTHSVQVEVEVEVEAVVKALRLSPCVLAVRLADALTWQCLIVRSFRSE